jgi:hypothetical protein
VLDDLAALVADDSEVLERHADHLASCDSCRDALHEAREAAARVPEAGADFAVPEDLEARVAGALDRAATARMPAPVVKLATVAEAPAETGEPDEEGEESADGEANPAGQADAADADADAADADAADPAGTRNGGGTDTEVTAVTTAPVAPPAPAAPRAETLLAKLAAARATKGGGSLADIHRTRAPSATAAGREAPAEAEAASPAEAEAPSPAEAGAASPAEAEPPSGTEAASLDAPSAEPPLEAPGAEPTSPDMPPFLLATEQEEPSPEGPTATPLAAESKVNLPRPPSAPTKWPRPSGPPPGAPAARATNGRATTGTALPARQDHAKDRAQDRAKGRTRDDVTARIFIFQRKGRLALASVMAGSAVALVAAWVLDRRDRDQRTDTPVAAAWSGKVEQVARAAGDGRAGLSLVPPGGQPPTPLAGGTPVAAGATLRTDARTRARLTLSDGTTVSLKERTEITLDSREERRIVLAGGELAADVAHRDGSQAAVFATPAGEVRVLGTRFVLAADDRTASVRVGRGLVVIRSPSGDKAEVPAGHEGVLGPDRPPVVAPAARLAESFRWTELGDGERREPGAEASASGLGTLRARKPGDTRDREHRLTLASHKVNVRIAGNVALTEIEEVFRNDGPETLEGIYSFPLGADASIERLALDVDGRLEEGAFVESRRASAIWRGVIRQATPEQKRQRNEEYVWVPGPWRDPALLQWQKGGRIELRIFPIPARGSRRLVLAYTQTISPYGQGRRYVYPLPHTADPALRVGRFEFQARVAGVEPTIPVVARGYGLEKQRQDREAGADATRLAFGENDFAPAGDILIDYALPQEAADLRWWTYTPGTSAPGASYVTFALRPKLPAWTESRPRDFVLLVDSSQSMVGERFARAGRLATAIVAELDRRDRVRVMACDVSCRSMTDAPVPAAASAARDTATWLGSQRPAGASDLAGALGAAVTDADAEAARAAGRDLHVIYVGDGTPTVGHRRIAALGDEAGTLYQRRRARVTTVGVGSDADSVRLEAIARAGGGHHLPYVPGQRADEAAMAVLEATYGVAMTDVEIALPAGITDVVPRRLPTLRAGQELLVSGRLGAAEVRGEVVVKGKVAGQPHVERHPVELRAAATAGNAFLPRLWAQQTIEELERDGRSEDQARIVELSRRFRVLSRHTSLLVLESDAMFRAFNVERDPAAGTRWTGEEEVEAEILTANPSGLGGRGSGLGGLGFGSGGGGVPGEFGKMGGKSRIWVKGPAAAQEAKKAKASASVFDEAPSADLPFESREVPKASSRRSMDPESTRGDLDGVFDHRPPPPRPGGRYMRRVWYPVAELGAYGPRERWDAAAVDRADEALRARPDSRDRHRALVQALSRAGELERAEEMVAAWRGRDPLDAEALGWQADLLGRRGRRDEALRLLSGTVDIEPESKALHVRLAEAYERVREDALACAHRIALAEIAADFPSVAAAVRCERARARDDAAAGLLDLLKDPGARQRAESLAASPAVRPPARGPVVVQARWAAGADLDIGVIGPRGNRISFMGGRARLDAEGAAEPDRERLALPGAGAGRYVIEISRADTQNGKPIRGELIIEAFGARRVFPFVLSGDRVPVARIDVRRMSRLEPI